MTLAARLILGAVFAVAGIAKLMDRDGTRQAVRALAVPGVLVAAVAGGLPIAELAVAGALLVNWAAVGGALGALVLLALFATGITVSLARGRQPDCRCFGQIHSAPIGWKTLARNAALAAVAVLVVTEGPGTSPGAWFSRLTGIGWLALAVALILACAFAVEGSALLTEWRRRGASTDQVGMPERAGVAPATSGLSVGTPAPDFSAPDLDGNRVTLGSLRAPGHPVLLIFTAAGCASCSSLLPDVGGWQGDHRNELTVALFSRGGAGPNRADADRHGLVNLLLPADHRVTAAYGGGAGTPSAVLVAVDGTVAGPLVIGPDAIRALVQPLLAAIPAPGQEPPEIDAISGR